MAMMADATILVAEYKRNRGQYTVGKIVKSQMKWVEHYGQNERWEIAEKIRDTKQGSCRKHGRWQLKWEDCVKKDLIMAEKE